MNTELVTFIKSQLAQGVDRVTITNMLKSESWSQVEIDTAFSAALAEPSNSIFPSYAGRPADNPVAPRESRRPLSVGKFRASYLIVRESWAVLMQDKELLAFPILAMIFDLLAIAGFAAAIFYGVMGGSYTTLMNFQPEDIDSMSYVITFLYYLVSMFIANFFVAGIYVIANSRFNGANMTFSQGIAGATKASGKIFLWSLISATVGIVLKIISDKSEVIGKIVASIFGAAWNILTYFSLPSLVIGGSSVTGSFSESASIIRKTWGEIIIINIGVGLFFGIISFVGILVAAFLAMSVSGVTALMSVGVILLVFLIVIGLVSSTLGSIFKLAVYNYARTGQVPQGFSPELVENVVTKKS